MSKLDELIAKHCPDGVEYVPVENLITRESKHANKFPNITKVYAVTKDYGIVDSLEYWNRFTSEKRVDAQIFSSDTSNYNVIRKGMFAYNPARLNIGSISYLKDGEDGLLSPMYVIFSINEERIMQEYFFIFLKSQKVLFKIDSMKEKGARFRFDFKNWGKITIPLPHYPSNKRLCESLIHSLSLRLSLRREKSSMRIIAIHCCPLTKMRYG